MKFVICIQLDETDDKIVNTEYYIDHEIVCSESFNYVTRTVDVFEDDFDINTTGNIDNACIFDSYEEAEETAKDIISGCTDFWNWIPVLIIIDITEGK